MIIKTIEDKKETREKMFSVGKYLELHALEDGIEVHLCKFNKRYTSMLSYIAMSSIIIVQGVG